MSYFNEDQQDYMRSLASIPLNTKCWCGWYMLGECPNGCPTDKTCADKMATKCPECGDTKLFPDSPESHYVNCSKYNKI